MNRAEVWLWGSRIAYLELTDNDVVEFEYDKDFIKSGIELSPIEMPLSTRIYSFPQLPKESFSGLPGLISDSLPDRFGNAVIDDWLARQGRLPESFNVIERLCYTGKRGMGALEYKPEMSDDFSQQVHIDELVNLASEVLNKRKKISVDLNENNAINQLFSIGTSAGGARAKAIIAWNKKTGEIRSGQIDAEKYFDYYIIKFDGVDNNGDHNLRDSQGYTRIEYAYYLMAINAGVNMMSCELFEENGRSHFMTKRFDRVDGKKIHTQTFGALCHIDYNTPNLASYELLAKRAKQIGLSQKEIEQIYRRMIFNVMAINYDDHVKNFTFLMDRNGKWSLSPAYDITYTYKENSRWISQHQMRINGKSKNIELNDLFEAGKSMNITKNKCMKIMQEVAKSIQHWPDFAKQANVSQEAIDSIQNHIQMQWLF